MAVKAEKKYVVDTSFNWADEMDVAEFCILTQSELDRFKKLFEEADAETFEYYCGTNEDVEFTKDEILGMLNAAQEITPEELEVINKFVPRGCRRSEVLNQISYDLEDEE